MATLRADLIKETTATAGTGTVTLAAVTGWARFSNAFSVSDVVPYIIIDDNGNKETGFGTIGASNTLARTTPSVTLVSGTYDNTTPTAITLSGSATVLCGPIAALTADTANIANDAVTYAKIQNVSATDKLLGRSTAGAGDVEEITCTAAARTVLDDTTVAAMVDTLGGASSTGTNGLVRATNPTLAGATLSGAIAAANNNVTALKLATFNGEVNNATTTGAVTVDWTTGAFQKQVEPTGAITYTFTAPAGPARLQLRIISDGTSSAFTHVWPASVKWVGATWAAVANKGAIISFWYDGTDYWAQGANSV